MKRAARAHVENENWFRGARRLDTVERQKLHHGGPGRNLEA